MRFPNSYICGADFAPESGSDFCSRGVRNLCTKSCMRGTCCVCKSWKLVPIRRKCLTLFFALRCSRGCEQVAPAVIQMMQCLKQRSVEVAHQVRKLQDAVIYRTLACGGERALQQTGSMVALHVAAPCYMQCSRNAAAQHRVSVLSDAIVLLDALRAPLATAL